MFTPPAFEITLEILNLIAAIDEFKGAWRASKPLPKPRLTALKHAAIIAGIAASTRIEGAQLADRDVELWLTKPKTTPSTPRDRREVIGFARVLEEIFTTHDDKALTPRLIRRLHRDLLGYDAKDPRSRYKTERNDLTPVDGTGQPLAEIATASPAATPRRVRDLVAWTNAELAHGALHPLLVIAIFVAAFLEIHPFEHGNGRLSRVLATLLLRNSGYTYVPYSALEAAIEYDKDDYYQAILAALAPAPYRQFWLSVFLRALLQQTQVLATLMEHERAVMAAMPDLSMQMTAHIATHGRATITELVALTGVNRNTLKYHLSQLVEARHLSLHGKGRGAWYELG